MKLSKKLYLLPLVAAALSVGWVVSSNRAVAHNDHDDDTIVGAWEVDADGAPYRPHLFTFHEDGTMSTTNPTNVQEDPSKPNGGTNDSVGMGTWKTVKKNGKTYVVGTFEQLNATADTHVPTDKLAVTFKLRVNNDKFEGPALAKQGPFSGPATLKGDRIQIDTAALQTL